MYCSRATTRLSVMLVASIIMMHGSIPTPIWIRCWPVTRYSWRSDWTRKFSGEFARALSCRRDAAMNTNNSWASSFQKLRIRAKARAKYGFAGCRCGLIHPAAALGVDNYFRPNTSRKCRFAQAAESHVIVYGNASTTIPGDIQPKACSPLRPRTLCATTITIGWGRYWAATRPIRILGLLNKH